jgi:hypothetical protein
MNSDKQSESNKKQEQAQRANDFEKECGKILEKVFGKDLNIYTDKSSTIPDGSSITTFSKDLIKQREG